MVESFVEGGVEKTNALIYRTFKLDRITQLQNLRAEAGAAKERLEKELKLTNEMLEVMDLQHSLILSDKDSAFFARGVLHVQVDKKYTAENNDDAL